MAPVTGQLPTVDEWIDALELLMRDVFFKYVQFGPKDRRVLIASSILCPDYVLEAIQVVLRDKLPVSSVLLMSAPVLAVTASGRATGLVVDVGMHYTTVTPVCEDVPLMRAMRAVPLGMTAVAEELRALLHEKSTLKHVLLAQEEPGAVLAPTLSFATLCDMVTRACHIAPPITQRQPLADIPYTISSNNVVIVPGEVRTGALDSIFMGDDDDQSIPRAILDSLLQCEPDVRAQTAAAMHVIGGLAQMDGFNTRLHAELALLAQREPKYAQLQNLIPKMRYVRASFAPNLMAWAGGSILAGLDGTFETKIAGPAR
eukprot:TRINITY_DN773_c0_g1_i5.p1 TRINITY_DN773_c0_g1~~TRINITY_DN773_c0_g1_i5.p1  ORF type:complete len:365 (-),score=72.15 TRINITY_DN773_c0_g1_i5:6-950(-)